MPPLQIATLRKELGETWARIRAFFGVSTVDIGESDRADELL